MQYTSDQLMQVNGIKAGINTPPALKGNHLHALPPYDAKRVHVVEKYPNCPTNWMHGSSKSSSYFVGVVPGRGLWFDFTMNDGHTHHIAVVISVQSINPVTGASFVAKEGDEGASLLRLQQHKDKCPTHDVDFEQDRYCPKCEFKWPAQNYIATTTGLQLWLDGFRKPGGEVRQYIITEEEMRGIAAQVIGEDRVWAIGFAFYLSKEPKPPTPPAKINFVGGGYDNWASTSKMGGSIESLGSHQVDPANYQTKGGGGGTSSSLGGVPISVPTHQVFSLSTGDVPMAGPADVTCSTGPSGQSAGPLRSLGSGGVRTRGGFKSSPSQKKFGAHSSKGRLQSVAPMEANETEMESSVEITTKLEIGAGARIGQEIGIDPNGIDFWQEEPAGFIYVNYVAPAVADKILKGGKREDKVEGSLDGLQVGN